MPLADVLDANERFLASKKPVDQLTEGASRKVAIITCIDGRLTDLVEPAMGFARGEAATIRVAGNTMAENDEIIRSLAAAVYVLDVREVYVVGHTECGLSQIKVFDFTEAMRKRNVPRDAISSMSILDWLGAFPDVKLNVQRTVEKIRNSAIIPTDVSVDGLVIETNSGRLQVVDGSLA